VLPDAKTLNDASAQFAKLGEATGDKAEGEDLARPTKADIDKLVDPGLIFLADTKCCGQNARTVAARPGWNTLSAVKQGRVFILDDDIASRWRPRIVDLAHAVAEAVTKASK
jgi:iron complex transport system substrate-binding protein